MPRSLRQRPRISYSEMEEPSLDEYVFCEKCNDYVYEYCSLHGALLVIPDNKVPAKPNFPSFVPRAALTIPNVFLHLNYSTIPGAGLGVFATLTLPRGVRFGPYRGQRTNDVTSDYSWQIYDQNNKPSYMVDASDGNKSNWMRYVNCSRHWAEQNLVAFQYQGQLYYRTIKIIPRFTELMVFYGSEYANLLHIDIGKYNSPSSYAQKFGAPATKKPIPKKLQPLEGNKHKLTSLSSISKHNVQKPKNYEENSTENKPLSHEGASEPKKRKIETQNITSRSENNENETQAAEETEKIEIVNRNAIKLNTEGNHLKPLNLIYGENKGTKANIFKTPCGNKTNVNTDSDCMIKKDFAEQNSFTNNLRHKTNGKSNKNLMKIEDVYFVCSICNYQSVTKDSLVKHMKFHDINRKYACEFCSYRFTENSNLKNHNFKRHGVKSNTAKIYECNICDFKSMLENDFKRHLRTHTGEKPYACSECDYKFSRASDLNRHLRTHTEEKPYACSECDYKCSRVGHLKTHLRTHTGEKPYACSECDYKFSQASDLKRHLRTHTEEKPYACSKCNYTFSKAGNLKTHLRTHTGEKPYACSECDYKFSQESSLKRHLRTHTGEKPYACSECDYKCSDAGNLKTHLRTHTGEKPYACSECDYKFSQASDLKRHLRTHTGEKPYACSECDYKCSQAISLKTHLRTHTGEKPYACSECDYKFSQAGHLKTHLRTHTGEKPYACSECDYKCSRVGNLKTHSRTHTGEKPYACSKCDYKCSDAGNLKTHLRTHTGEKPYACDICDYKCTRLNSLRNHLKNKHLK